MKSYLTSLSLLFGALVLLGRASAFADGSSSWASDAEGEAFEWQSFIALKPSSDIYQSCWHCNSLDECRAWCSGVSACRSVLWTDSWKTCEGYDKAYHKDDLFEDSSRFGANYTYFLKCPHPSHAPTPTLEDNVPPQIVKAVGAQEGQVGLPFVQDMSENFQDANYDTLSFIATGLPKGIKVHAHTGEVSGMPKQQGRYKVVVSATDGKSEPVSLPPYWFIVRDANGNMPDASTDVKDTMEAAVMLERSSGSGPHHKKKSKSKSKGGKNKKVHSHPSADAPAAAPASIFAEFDSTSSFLEMGELLDLAAAPAPAPAPAPFAAPVLSEFADAPAPAPFAAPEFGYADAPASAPAPAPAGIFGSLF